MVSVPLWTLTYQIVGLKLHCLADLAGKWIFERSGSIASHNGLFAGGTFSSVKELVEKTDDYAQNSNRQAQPFVWTATADSILAKVERLCERIYGTAH
jgi:hypothetical protein